MSHSQPAAPEQVLPHRAARGVFGRGLPRAEGEEWLDLGRGTPADAAANLDEMARTHRWLGGLRALTKFLYPRLLAAPGPMTVLDLGTGSAAVPLAIERWARQRGLRVVVLALDSSARNLAVAAERVRAPGGAAPAVRLLRADAGRLPLAPGSVDFVISTLFAHHFAPNELAALLRAAASVARRGVLMSDVVRGWLPLAAFRLAQPVFARHAFTRHDGALSIRRAYTPAELRAVAQAAGLAGAQVHTVFPWRQTLVADLPAGPHD